MKIKAVCEITGLTDRTIRYYIEEQLISPSYSENYLGRKAFDFSQEDVETLNHISVLRKFDFTVAEIKEILYDAEKSKEIIPNVKSRNGNTLAAAQILQTVLCKINDNKAYTLAELALELASASSYIPITEETKQTNYAKRVLSVLKTTLLLLVIWLPVLFQFLFFTATLQQYAYPRFYTGAKIYMISSVFPSILTVFLNKIKQTWKRIAKTGLVILCLLSLLCSYFVLHFPPGIMAMSETRDFAEYRDFDTDCLANRDPFLQELFPLWPRYFTNIIQDTGSVETVYLDAHYYYRYISIMDYTYDIYAQWPLEEKAFIAEVDRVETLFESRAKEYGRKYEILQKGNFICFFAYSGNAPFQAVTGSYTYYIFAYDESNLTVRYIVCDSLENGADQPYYLSLDW